NGDEGDDTLEGGAGADNLNAGTGFNFASYAGAGAAVRTSLGGDIGLPSRAGDAVDDVYAAGTIHGLIGSAHADVLGGSDAFANELRGGGGADTLYGGGGADTL